MRCAWDVPGEQQKFGLMLDRHLSGSRGRIINLRCRLARLKRASLIVPRLVLQSMRFSLWSGARGKQVSLIRKVRHN
jgi:hypothetical protein